MSEWQPIETAPSGSEPVLLLLPRPLHSNDLHGWVPWDEIRVAIGWQDYSEGDWTCCFMADGGTDSEGYTSHYFMDVRPTHWMPLPIPPLQPEASAPDQSQE